MTTEALLDRCLRSSFQELQPLFKETYELARSHFSNDIHFSMPSVVHFDALFHRATNPYRFPAISVTGRRCSLNCEHCGGRILENMIPATTPKRLWKACTKIEEEGGTGCLISGGSLKNGSVPLAKFVHVIKRIKSELNLDVAVHTGLVHEKLAESLAETGIDAAMIDIIGSNETIRDVYHLDLTVDAFDHSLSLLEQNGIPFVPHVTVGLHYGKLRGERKALQIISKHRPAAVVVIAFMPLKRTPMEPVAAPPPLDIARVILASKFMMPNTPLLLGCARPGGKHKSKTDVLAIKAGVSGMAYPSKEGYEFAKKSGLAVRFSDQCCALAYKDLIGL